MDEQEERRKKANELQTCRNAMASITHGEIRMQRKHRYAELGVCATCEHMHGETTQYGTKRFWCSTMDFGKRTLSPTDPIVDCTDYFAAGQMSLSLMFSMAVPIEVKRSKKMGFLYTEEEICGLPLDEYALSEEELT